MEWTSHLRQACGAAVRSPAFNLAVVFTLAAGLAMYLPARKAAQARAWEALR